MTVAQKKSYSHRNIHKMIFVDTIYYMSHSYHHLLPTIKNNKLLGNLCKFSDGIAALENMHRAHFQVANSLSHHHLKMPTHFTSRHP